MARRPQIMEDLRTYQNSTDFFGKVDHGFLGEGPDFHYAVQELTVVVLAILSGPNEPANFSAHQLIDGRNFLLGHVKHVQNRLF